MGAYLLKVQIPEPLAKELQACGLAKLWTVPCTPSDLCEPNEHLATTLRFVLGRMVQCAAQIDEQHKQGLTRACQLQTEAARASSWVLMAQVGTPEYEIGAAVSKLPGFPPVRYITHKACGKTSYNPSDVNNRYCGHCKVFIDDQGRAQAPAGQQGEWRGERAWEGNPALAQQPAAPGPQQMLPDPEGDRRRARNILFSGLERSVQSAATFTREEKRQILGLVAKLGVENAAPEAKLSP